MGRGLLPRRPDQPDTRLDEPRLGRIAAHRPRRLVQTHRLRRPLPHHHRRRGRRRRILGIKRQQHDLVGIERLHRRGGLVAHRVPIAHGDEGPHLALLRQHPFQRPRLGLRILQQRRTAADQVIDRPGRLGPSPCERIGQRQPQHARQAQDAGIVEQVEQERTNGLRPVRSAQVEQHDGYFRFLRHSAIASPRSAFVQWQSYAF
jgi:hypothetical protein